MLREPVDRAYSRVAHAGYLMCARPKQNVTKPHNPKKEPPYCTDEGIRASFDKAIAMEYDGVVRCLKESGLMTPINRMTTNHNHPTFHVCMCTADMNIEVWDSAVDCWVHIPLIVGRS